MSSIFGNTNLSRSGTGRARQHTPHDPTMSQFKRLSGTSCARPTGFLLHRIKKGTDVPTFVLEFLLARYCVTPATHLSQDALQADRLTQRGPLGGAGILLAVDWR